MVLPKIEPYILSVKESHICEQGATYLRLGRWKSAPLARPLRSHYHPEIEIALFLQGHGKYVIHDQTFDIEPGDIFIFNSMQQHCVSYIEGPSGLTYITIHFERRFIWSSGSNMFDRKYLRVFDTLEKNQLSRLQRGPITDEITSLILDMEQEFFRKDAGYEPMIKATLLRVLVLLNRLMPSADEEDASYSSSHTNLVRIERAMEYIHDHLAEPILLSDLAQQAHMSECYFSTVFKKLNGVSPWVYITIKRIEKACVLLKQSSQSITEVSAACGYNNTANFNRAFRQIMKMSPSDYRKNPDIPLRMEQN